MRKNKSIETELRLLNCGDASALYQSKKRLKMNGTGKRISQPDYSGKFFDNLIDVENVAEVLGVAPKTIRKWVSIRFIPFVRVGRRVMFRPKSIELWLNQKETKPCQ